MKKIIYGLFAGLLLSTSCDFLEENPASVVKTENFYTSEDEAVLAVNGVYRNLADRESDGVYSLNIIRTEQGTWAAAQRDGKAPQSAIGLYAATSEYVAFKGLWNVSYYTIVSANAVIENVGNMALEEITPEAQNRIIAEAKFLRALSYFNLVRWFGGAPLILEGIPDTQDMYPERTSVEQIYAQIIEDLEFAEMNLYHKSGSASTPQYKASDIGRATVGAAQALLGKVYLTMASMKRHGLVDNSMAINSYDWVNETTAYENAKTYTGKVIDSNDYMLVDNYVHNFISDYENNAESVFEVQFGGLSKATSSSLATWSNIAGRASGVTGTAYARVAVTAELTKAYEQSYTGDKHVDDINTDPRFIWNIGSMKYNKGAAKYQTEAKMELFTFRKFRDYEGGADFSDTNFPVIRYADVLLMHAEAANELNDPATAVALVNQVRARARKGVEISGLGEPADVSFIHDDQVAPLDRDPATTDQATVRDWIYLERNFELCFEGHARFDDVRFGVLIDKVKAGQKYKANGINVNSPSYYELLVADADKYKSYGGGTLASKAIADKDILFPIPFKEMNLNPNLVQNTGW